MEILKSLREEEPSIELELNGGEDPFIATDLANQYLLQLIQEKNEQGARYAMTEGIIVGDRKNSTILEACRLLVHKYIALMNRHTDLEGIYTVVNVTYNIEKGAHQNWFFFDVPRGHILRFEPNGPRFDEEYGLDYRFADLLDCIGENTGITWSQSHNESINNFNGCRATSTILAVMDLMGIDLDRLSTIEKPYYRSLAIAFSNSLKSERCKLPPLPWKRRRTKELITFIEPRVRGEEVVPVEYLESMNKQELRSYLRSQGIPFSKSDTDSALLQKAFEFQKSLLYIEPVVRGGEEVPVVDLGSMTVPQLKQYLQSQRVPFSSRDRKPALLQKALEFQNSMDIVQ